MDCHIVPMSYLKQWSENGSEKPRADRQSFCFCKKDCDGKYNNGKLTKQEKIPGLSIEDYYLNGNDKRIEDYLSSKEKMWSDIIGDVLALTKRGRTVRSKNKKQILEFVVFQLYRNPMFINTYIEIIYKIIGDCFSNDMVESFYSSTEEHIKRIIMNNKDYSTNQKLFRVNNAVGIDPISKSIKDFNKCKISFIVSNYMRCFAVSDKPAFILKDIPCSGLYMPISPSVCIYIFKCKNPDENHYYVYDADETIVDYINFRTIQNAKDIIISLKSEIKTIEIFPQKAFEKMMSFGLE